MKKLLIVFVTIAFVASFVADDLLGSEAIDENEQEPDRPAVGIEDLIAASMEGVAALGVGAAVGYGTFLGTSIVTWVLMGGSLDEDNLGPMLLAGFAAGYGLGVPLGSALGASSVGRLANQGGSFWWSWAGAEIGAISAAGFAWIVGAHSGYIDTGQPILALCPAAGAVIGYNLSRWMKGSERTSNSSDGLDRTTSPQLSIFVPQVELRHDRLSREYQPTYKLTVARLTF